MILKGIALLASITSRTELYLRSMTENKLYPEHCIVYLADKALLEQNNNDLYGKIIGLLDDNDISYEFVLDKDINSDTMMKSLQNIPQKYCIYSGYGGYILKPHLFNIGKKYIHVHAGILPAYRGSTTAYYSILKESCIGATAIFLNEKIDQGDILYQEIFPMPQNDVNIDYVYEPWVRSIVLVKTLKIYVKLGCFYPKEQGDVKTETYFIIHPVLKHLALLKVEKFKGQFKK